MRRTICLLLLMINTFNIPCCRFSYAATARFKDDFTTREEDHESWKEVRPREARGDDTLPQPYIKEETSRVIGKWRNNGEALEPKWRDGDAVLSFPFSHFTRSYSKEDASVAEYEDEYETPRGDYDYLQTDNRDPSASRSRHNRRNSRVKTNGNYKATPVEQYDGYDNDFSRSKNERSQTNDDYVSKTIFFDGVKDQETASNDGAQNRTNGYGPSNKNKLDKAGTVSVKQQEVFQVRSNEYEHELSDEEYLKPRPRKRRPPQNYEFALVVNETLIRNGKPEVSSSSSPSPSPSPSPSLGPSSRGKQKSMLSTAATLSPQHNRNEALKSLLKMQQEEGLSLSEILQRKNLTLHDLLRGKAEIINALKSEDIDEIGENMEEISKAMSNSLTKLSSTQGTPWTLPLSPVASKNNENENEMTEDFRNTTRSSHFIYPLSYFKNNDTSTEKINVITQKSTRYAEKTSKSISVGAKIPPSLITTSSMTLLEENDNNTKLKTNYEIRAENLDNEEIMEFSDFTDYMKGNHNRSVSSSIIINENNAIRSIKKLNNDRGSIGSTLSIEKLLIPTERTFINDNFTNNDSVDPTDNTMVNINGFPSNAEETTKGFVSFSNIDYQDDVPMDNTEDVSNTDSIIDKDNNSYQSEIPLMVKDDMNTDTEMRNENYFITKHTESSLNSQIPVVNCNYSLEDQENTDSTKSKNKPYEDILSELESEARAEIFELFASSSSGKRLERLLKSRNMSLEELIALRQRGSSKVHLAEVSRLRDQKALQISNNASILQHNQISKYTLHKNTVDKFENKNETQNDKIEKDHPAILNNRNFSHNSHIPLEKNVRNISVSNLLDLFHSLKANTTIFNSDHDNNDNIADTISLILNSNETNKRPNVSNHTTKTDDPLNAFASLPFDKHIREGFISDNLDYINDNKTTIPIKDVENNGEIKQIDDAIHIIQNVSVEERMREDLKLINANMVHNESKNTLTLGINKNYEKALAKVKPSIIASGAILGVTIVVFLAIFITCRIRQKQKYAYRNTFSRAVFQGPTMAARKLSNSSSMSTIMVNVVATSTAKRSGRNEPQNVTDNFDSKCDIDNDSLDANDSWETIPDYVK